MKKTVFRSCLVLFFIATFVVPHSTEASTQLIDIGTLGGEYAFAQDINNRGQIVGGSTLEGGIGPGSSDVHESERAFLWEKGEMINLGTAGALSSSARRISDNGKITGTVVDSRDPWVQRVFLWENGKMTTLESFGGAISFPTAINNRGHIVGVSTYPDSIPEQRYYHAVLWQDGKLISLETPGEEGSRAVGLNESGQVLVIWWYELGEPNAFVWKDGRRTDLGTLGGCCTHAASLNDSGQVTGGSFTTSGELHAFVWKNGRMTDLGVPEGWNSSSAAEINNAGQVLLNLGYPAQPFIWERGVFRQLEDPYGLGGLAQKINAKGQVSGYLYINNNPWEIAPVFWDTNGTITVQSSLATENSGTTGINNRGQVIGWIQTPDFQIRSFLWNSK
jgi:probable HAF family extracellular repeat protein